MNYFAKPVLLVLLVIQMFAAAGQSIKNEAIVSGVSWFDDQGKVVSAHGANLVKDNGKYYFFGEAHSDTSNAFAGFNCYSSVDLYNWKFERVALPVQASGKLGPNRVGERPKVMKCPSTGEYIMYMHADTLGYKDQFVGYATSSSITGPYLFKGPILFEGKPIRKWDMGTFQDYDGGGYVLIHGGEIYKLTSDYKAVAEKTNANMTPGFESPTIFRKGDTYFFIGSHLTSWERNDNDYYTATSLRGPWTFRGIFAPAGTLTWNSQTTFVFPIQGSIDTTFLFMGDRWSFPKQASAATYVWQPIKVTGDAFTIDPYQHAWQVNTKTGVASPVSLKGKIVDNVDTSKFLYTGKWVHESIDTLTISLSDRKDESITIKFNGTGISFYGISRPDGGYAKVILKNNKGKIINTSIVDMYCKYPVKAIKYVSKPLKKNNYSLTISVLGERGNWSDKRKNVYGSTGYVVAVDEFLIKE